MKDNIPPHDIEAERAVIGSMLVSGDGADRAITALGDVGADAFYAPAHQYIYEAIAKLYEAKSPIDPLLVIDKLTRSGHIEASGGLDYIAEVSGSAPTSANVEYYSRIVRERYTLRQVISNATNTIREAYALPEDVDGLVEGIQARTGALVQAPEDTLRHISDVTPEFREYMVKVARGEMPPGLMTGLQNLDDLTGGLRQGDYVVVAARPSVGKTAFALNVAAQVIQETRNAKVVIFSMEMDNNQLLARLCQSLNSVNFRYMEQGADVDQNTKLMDEALRLIKDTNLFVDDTPHPTIQDVVRKMRAFQSEHGDPDLLIIDYLQLMTAKGKFGTRNEEVSHISRTVKGLAREMRCPALVLSQFNRENPGKRPIMSQLRESGSIEQDADSILILHPDQDDQQKYDVLWCFLDKQRNGPTGFFPMRFTKKYQLMESITVDEAKVGDHRTQGPRIVYDMKASDEEQEEILF